MLEITCYDNDGKKLDHLTQWDMGQTVSVKGATYVGSPVFHFCNRRSYRAYAVESTTQDDSISAKIPNALLKEPYPIEAYMYYQKEPGSAKTVYAFSIPVTPRKQPDDYIFTDNVDVISLIEIKKEMMAALEELRAAIQDSKDSIVQVTTVIDEAKAATQEATSASAYANAAAETAAQATTDARAAIQEAGHATEAATQAATAAGQAAASATNAAQSATDAANKADTAAGRVDTAIQDATTAAGNANTAAESATTAAGKADASSGKADASAGKADAATAEANSAATAATGASEKANTAAAQATDAAKTATDATATATSAASKADAAATAANEASAKATQAATEAITAKNEAATAATTATEAAGRADTATQGANTAADAANAAAKAANDAAEKAKIDVAGKLDKPTAAPKVNDVLKVESVNPDGSFNAVWSEPPATVVVDETLQNAGQAADAAKTGEELKKLDKNKENVIVKSAFGESIILDDSGEAPLASMKLFGRAEQEMTTGKNLLPNTAITQTTKGVTFTVNSDGSVTASGTAAGGNSIFELNRTFNTPGDYIATGGLGPHLQLVIYYQSLDGKDVFFTTSKEHPFTLPESNRVSYYLQVLDGYTVNATAYPMIRRASETDPTYEPYTGGIPSPNPDYPQPLVSPGDDGDIGVSVCGKNLCKSYVNNNYTNIYTTTLFVDAELTPNTTYTLSVDSDAVCRFYVNEYITKEYVVLTTTVGRSSITLTTVDVIDQSDYISGYGWVFLKNSQDNPSHTISNVQLELGPSATTYEPYTGGSIAIPTPNGLPGIKVNSGGNYTDATGQQWVTDEVDFARGVYVKRVGQFVANGTESWTSQYNAVYTDLHDAKKYIQDEQDRVFSERFTPTKTNYSSLTYGEVALYNDGADNFPGQNWLYLRLSNDGTTSAMAKEFFAANPTKFIYELATPVETPLSPELIAAYRALHTNLPNTNILNDEGCEMSVSYFTDTEVGKYISGLSRSSVRTDPATKSPVTLGYDDGGLYIMTE